MLPSALSSFEPSPQLRRVLEGLRARGHEVWIVGGAVRDRLLGFEAAEFDLATSALPEEVAASFPKVVETGIAHGTVTVVEDGEGFEVTTYRGGGAYRGEGAPTWLSSIEEDLSMRDFTINAMAFDPLEGRFLDPHGGRDDLERRMIRAVGDPYARFSEDPLRPQRACRFAARFGFLLERRLRRSIPSFAERFGATAIERRQAELSKTLLSPHPRYGIELLRNTKLLAELIPELLEGVGLRQNRWHRYDVYHHVLRALDASPPRLAVRLAVLLHDIDKPGTAAPSPKAEGEWTFYNHEVSGASLASQICERLRYPNKLVSRVERLVREHQFVYTEEWSDGAVRRMLARVGEDHLEDLFAVREADLKGRGYEQLVQEGLENLRALEERVHRLLEARPALATTELAIGGWEVMEELGLEPSPMVGEALRHLLEQVLEDPSRNQEQHLLAELRRWWLAQRGSKLPQT